MDRLRALELLTQSKPTLAAALRGNSACLFGSTARNNARSDSDIDILVAFDGPATSERYFGVQFYLEDLFGCKIDLVTEKALRVELRHSLKRGDPCLSRRSVNGGFILTT